MRPRTPWTLQASVEQLFADHGLTQLTINRETKLRLVVVFRTMPEAWWRIIAELLPRPAFPSPNPDVLDDALYDAIKLRLGRWLEEHPSERSPGSTSQSVASPR